MLIMGSSQGHVYAHHTAIARVIKGSLSIRGLKVVEFQMGSDRISIISKEYPLMAFPVGVRKLRDDSGRKTRIWTNFAGALAPSMTDVFIILRHAGPMTDVFSNLKPVDPPENHFCLNFEGG